MKNMRLELFALAESIRDWTSEFDGTGSIADFDFLNSVEEQLTALYRSLPACEPIKSDGHLPARHPAKVKTLPNTVAGRCDDIHPCLRSGG